MYEKEEVEGAFWLKDMKDGGKYMSGSITVRGEEFKVSIFRNDKGGNDKRPDYRMKLAKAPDKKEPRHDPEVPF